jgi:hypothetical protein
MMSQLNKIEYKGFSYQFEMDYEEDNMKIFHESVDQNGKRILMDFSPYYQMTQHTFELWVESGMPNREHLMMLSPLKPADIKIYHLIKTL